MSSYYDTLVALAAEANGEAPITENRIHFSISHSEMGGPGAPFDFVDIIYPSSEDTVQSSYPVLVAGRPQETISLTAGYEAQNSLLGSSGIFGTPPQTYYLAEYKSNQLAQTHDQDNALDDLHAETVLALEAKYFNLELCEETADSTPDIGAAVEEGVHYDSQMQEPQVWNQSWMTTDQGTASSASPVSTQSHSSPVTPSPTLVPVLLPVPVFYGEVSSYQLVQNFLETLAVQQKTVYPTKSRLTFKCPFKKRNGRRCEELLIHNLQFLSRHIRKHDIAGELPQYVADCALCADRDRYSLAKGRRIQIRKGETQSDIRSFVRHIFNIHFGGDENPCLRCFKSYSRPDALTRHMRAHEEADRKAERK